jgi:hypothetical protein
MLYNMLFFTDIIEPFQSQWGVIAQPIPYDNGYVLPVGWEEELSERNIEFSIIEIQQTEEEED